MVRAPQVHTIEAGAVRNGAISFDDLLQPDELLTGTPTVTASPSGLTLSNKAISDSELTINDVVVAAGRAIRFSVTSNTPGRYVISATCGTNSTPAQTIPVECILNVD